MRKQELNAVMLMMATALVALGALMVVLNLRPSQRVPQAHGQGQAQALGEVAVSSVQFATEGALAAGRTPNPPQLTQVAASSTGIAAQGKRLPARLPAPTEGVSNDGGEASAMWLAGLASLCVAVCLVVLMLARRQNTQRVAG